MRYFQYIWASLYPGTPWIMGNGNLQLLAWAVGLIVPVVLLSGLFWGVNKTIMALSLLATIAAGTYVIWWLLTLDYWIHAPPPADCSRDYCDNDGTIRTLFSAGAISLPVVFPSLLSGPLAFVVALRRVAARKQVPA